MTEDEAKHLVGQEAIYLMCRIRHGGECRRCLSRGMPELTSTLEGCYKPAQALLEAFRILGFMTRPAPVERKP